MSSSRLRRAWSLRARLLVMLLLVVAALCATIGVATEVALHRYLINKADNQLEYALDRALNSPKGDRGPFGGGPDPGGADNLPPGTLTATVYGDHVVGSLIPLERGDRIPLKA